MKERMRTLGFYSPFGTLMLHDKIETRWVREGKKPPFPKGQYLFYHTQKACDHITMLNWSGQETMQRIHDITRGDATKALKGYAIGIGELCDVAELEPKHESLSYVKYVGSRKIKDPKTGIWHSYVQWGLHFDNVRRIKPFKWNFGKQGVGFVPELELPKIVLL